MCFCIKYIYICAPHRYHGKSDTFLHSLSTMYLLQSPLKDTQKHMNEIDQYYQENHIFAQANRMYQKTFNKLNTNHLPMQT